MAWPPEIRLPANRDVSELHRGNAVLLHLYVQRLVVGLEQPRRLALVSVRGLKGALDRLPLRLGDRATGNLLQRRALLSSSRMNLAPRHDARNSRASDLVTRESQWS